MLTLTVISVILVLVSGGNPNPSGGGPPKGQNPPPNPCGDGVKVTCPECKHAASDAACAALDQWITCPSPNGICYRFNQTNSALGTRITKGCLPIPSCENAALQPGDQACDKVAADPSATNCRSCNFDEAQCPPTDPTPTPPPAPPTQSCICWGDPHCQPIGMSAPLLITGSCKHTLATDHCPGAEVGTFKVDAKFERAKAGLARSFVSELRVEYTLDNGEQAVLELENGGTLVMNNHNNQATEVPVSFPFMDNAFPGIQVEFYDDPESDLGADWQDSPLALEINFSSGMTIRWDGVKQVEVALPTTMVGGSCGICAPLDSSGNMIIGKLDQSHADDTSGCPNKAASGPMGSITTDAQEMANSWIETGDETDQACLEECGGS